MKEPSITELQQMARETFGHDLDEAEAAAYRKRLPTMVRAVSTLQGWEKNLRNIEPAVVYSAPVPEPYEDGAG